MKKRLTKIIFVFTAVFCVFILAGCQSPQVSSLRETESPKSSSVVVNTSIVEINKDGFKPKAITVLQGDTVIFTNLDSTTHQIAADPHPNHDIIPDLYSTPIFENGTYRFTFSKTGTFGLHLEDNPSVQAKIIVE